MINPGNYTVERSSVELSKEDFVSDQMVKWCPGCGAHAILSSVANVFPKLGYRKENIMMVSGIGCSSRFPYYVNTYGIHGIHGRAAAISSGVKIANPHLSVWMTTGDGDSLAIGGNHFIHIIRRNIDINILLFNNQIYGLTKGQYSPTTPMGSVTKTSPMGTIEHPFNPGELVMGAQGTFFARVVDTNPRLMTEVMFEAARHDGTSVIEILQNCVIFADKTHDSITGKEVRDDRQIVLRNGFPMIFGKEKNKGIRLNGTRLEVVTIGEKGITEKDILVHDMYERDPGIHLMLAKMSYPNFPVALGVIRSANYPTYDDLVMEQIDYAKAHSNIKNVDDLLNSGETWEIK
ncbi:MAG: 2-oxoacid:ferredoxin oxidoreductase subunit beta [Lentimicrobium sp.]|jgi:2-oxoglutarate ferredoxin oxidoreductase subunit beta|nr:2-oxoacid:ferredoxin oxidoreductase subunit beta [Lentimicrobium sp.]MDD2527056.1 2-oxoacid:ferredoxin oxidoreductase subunit beta [Lentimicrobiaceae bacterium]MDD4597625.1 2-oxoacid:ferredoxin oxidoreductase subunit beta [Lentimicrobiaceae bacterium]MDY0027186.1 2-oxoacid:ferredoxin oxidoreductase subunit beta [Lentimicrobium sp.]HAH56634.1 2-oxoacid:ferredoxin oxidoreductase subunit beta [Bacteroidales bacterium]